MMRLIGRAGVWALAGSLTGVLTWSAMAATLWPLYYPPETRWQALRDWPLEFVGSAIWASVIGAAALPVYFVLFAYWLSRVPRSIRTDQLLSPPLNAALVLGTPLALLLIWEFAHTAHFPLEWTEAARIASIALPSCWLAVWVP